METIAIKPGGKKEIARIRASLKKLGAGADHGSPRTETLEEKIVRLYGEGHYSDVEMRMFFEIPKEYRVDPFLKIADGDVYWADRRNVEQLARDLERSMKAMEAGETVTLRPGDSLEEFWERIMADESI